MADKKKSLDQLLIENEELKLRLAAKEATIETFRESENKYTAVYNSMSEGLAIHELVYDSSGKAIDYIIKDVNSAFEQITGLKKKKAVGRKATDVYEVSTAPYLDIYTKVALTGDPQTFETYFPPMEKHFQVSVFSPSKGKFVTVFQDITERIRLEEVREQLLHEVERQAAWLNASISSMATGIIMYGLDGKAIHMNETAKKLLPEELFFNSTIEERSKIINWETEYGKPFPPEEIPVKRAFNGETTNNVVLSASFHDHKLWITTNAAPILSADGKTIGVVASFLDITENKNAEIALRLSEERLRVTLSSIGDAVMTFDNMCRVVFLNPVATKLTGWNQKDAEGKPVEKVFRIINELTQVPAEDIVSKVLKEGKTVGLSNHTALIAKNGTQIPIEDSAAPIRDVNGNISGVVLVFHDVTEKRLAQEALRESEERFRNLVKNAPTAIYEIDFTTRKFTTVNDSMCKLSGYSRDELLSIDSLDLLDNESRKLFLSRIHQSMKGEIPVENVEYKVKSKDGRLIDAVLNMKFNFNDMGIPIGAMVVGYDITKRKQSEEELRESEKKFLALFNLSPLPMTLSSVEDGIYHDVNDSFIKDSEFTREEVIGRTSTDLNLFVVNDMHKQILDETWKKGTISGLPCDLRLKNGKVLNCLISSSSVIIKGTVYLLSSIQDVTDFRRTREELKISETRFRTLAENIPDMIVRFDKDLKLLYGNEAVIKRTGRQIEFLAGKTAKEYGASSESDRNWEKAAKEVINTGKPCRLEQENIWQGISKVYDALIVPERDESGKVNSIISIARDITEMKKAENILSKSEQRLKYHLENSPLAVVEWDKEFNIIQWSNEAERIFGLDREEVIGVRIDMLNIIYPDDIPFVEKTISRLTSGKEIKVVSQNRNITKTGLVRECIWYNSVLLDEKGEMSSVMSLVEDVTTLHRTEKELIQSRESYRELVTNARSIIVKLDTNGRFTFVNEFAESFFGFTNGELLGKSVMETIVPPKDSTGRDLGKMVNQIIDDPDNFSINVNENITKDGEIVWVEWHNKAVFDEKGERTGHIAIGLNITPRKKVQEALKESERTLRSVLDATKESIYMFDKEGRIVMSNATGIRRLNRKEENEVVVHHISEFMTSELAKKRLVKINEVFKSGIPLTYDDERESKAYQHNLFPVFKDDEVIYVVTYSTDITEQKKAEISLKQSEDRFRTIAESLTVIVSITKICDSTLTFLNEPFEKSFGYNKSEILGTRMPDIYFFPDDNKFLIDSLKVKGLVENVEVRVKNREGIPFWIMTSIRKINYMNEASYLTASIDISETKKTQEELLRLNRTLDAQSKSSQAMMHSRNEQEYLTEICKIIIEDCGHAMVWVGYAQNDAQKSVKPVAHFGFDQGYIDHMNITWDDSDRGSGPTGIAIKTGRPSICRHMLTDPCFGPWRDAAIKRGYASSVVLPLKSEGKAYGAISIYSKDPDPFTDSEIDLLTELADDLAYGILFIRLTEYEKEATRAIKENEIRLKELIATKDKFFNIIAHDLKNPFTSLLGASELLYDNITQMSEENIKKLALILNDSAKGGYSILQNLLDWSRSQTGQLKFNPENINLKNVIDENIDNLQLQVNNKEINLKSDQIDDLFITGDKNMINTVLRNLLSNAVKYTSKNGIIRVMVTQDKGNITLTVKDNGIGISIEKVELLFKLENSLSLPGTAKEQGTGLGLKLCKEFTEKMGGRIWVESEVGKGSEFKFTIPMNGTKA
jgi:PAS domain S-box-containing protein